MWQICMNCGEILHKDLTKCNHCDSSNIEELNSSATLGDYFIICKISNDPQFIKAMMELHDTDIIEYTSKMSQFKSQVQTENSNVPHCPTCNSTKLSKVSSLSKAGSVFMFGLLSQKVKKTWHCDNCGYEW